MGAKGSEDPPFTELESVGVPTNLVHVTDITSGNGREVAVPSLEEPTVRTVRALVDWKLRFWPVKVPSVYSKTEWVLRRLMPKVLCAGLDIPADVREREQAMYPPEGPEPKRCRRDLEPADVPPPTPVSASLELEAVTEVQDEGPTITPTAAEAEDRTETASEFCSPTGTPYPRSTRN
jgi:hypothetical protein